MAGIKLCKKESCTTVYDKQKTWVVKVKFSHLFFSRWNYCFVFAIQIPLKKADPGHADADPGHADADPGHADAYPGHADADQDLQIQNDADAVPKNQL